MLQYVPSFATCNSLHLPPEHLKDVTKRKGDGYFLANDIGKDGLTHLHFQVSDFTV